MQCTYNVTSRRVRANIVALEKQNVFHIPSVCLVALFVQCAMRMRHILIHGLSYYIIFFSTFISFTARFSKKKIFTGHKTCVLVFSTTFVLNISRFKKMYSRDMMKNMYRATRSVAWTPSAVTPHSVRVLVTILTFRNRASYI
jgi:hypothetical protein